MIGLVTGASRGLGLELIKVGLEHGDQMIAGWIGDEEEKVDLMLLQSQFSRQLMILRMDVTDEQGVEVDAIKFSTQFEHLDYLVNNAGVLLESKYEKIDPIKELDIAMLRKTLEVNTVGPAIVLKKFIPFIYKAEAPCVINITSEAGHLSSEGHVYMAYSISKHGVNMYTQKIRNYLVTSPGKEKVRIFMVHPGRMQTVMGAENAQISPRESAEGIYSIIDKTLDPQLDIPFVNYKGEAMPY